MSKLHNYIFNFFKVRESQAQLEVREDKVKELRLQLETVKEGESRQATIVNTLRAQLSEYEAQAGSMEGVASRREVAINSLQKECSNYQTRILELEERLKYAAFIITKNNILIFL